MSPEAKTILNEWSPPIAIDLALFLTTLFYLRGWLALRRSCSGVISAPRLAAFFAGMFFLWIAIGSPLTAFDEASLTVHMIQHILLVLVIPPLVLLGAPWLPLLHGLPQSFVRTALGPSLRWPPVHSLGRLLTHPLVEQDASGYVGSFLPGKYPSSPRQRTRSMIGRPPFCQGRVLPEPIDV